MRALKLRLGPYFSLDIEDMWAKITTKLGWTDLHRHVYALSSPPIASISPGLTSQINTRDSRGWTPFLCAVIGNLEAVHILLCAGANPRMNNNLVWAVRAGANTVISALLRAGAYINLPDAGGSTALHWAANTNLAYSINGLAVALELVRHGAHMLDWNILDEYGCSALGCAQERVRQHPWDKDSKKIVELYDTRRIPAGAQYLPAPPLIDITDESAKNDINGLPPTSLIRAGLKGDLHAIGDLIQRGAMVNERDADGRTLLHLIALGQASDGYRVALELARHGGWGVDWLALLYDKTGGWTALQVAEGRLRSAWLSNEERDELRNVRDLLQGRRLPPGEEYLWPCMDPDFYKSRMSGALDN